MSLLRNGRFWLVFGPSLAAILLAVAIPDQLAFLLGTAAAWVVVATSVFRSRERMEYQAAIRLMRRGNYVEAIRTMDVLINAEPHSVDHRHFRAELYRLSGDLERAAADYNWMIGRDAGKVPGHIGLAEIAMQQGDKDRAREHALAALEQDKSWMAAYNLGWIEDRRGDAEAAVKNLEMAFTSGIPHSRFRLLARLWLARNYHRLGRDEDARNQLVLLHTETNGLRDWHAVFESDQGVGLRASMGDDVYLAQQLLKAETTLEALD